MKCPTCIRREGRNQNPTTEQLFQEEVERLERLSNAQVVCLKEQAETRLEDEARTLKAALVVLERRGMAA